jgi:hypothetical protein
MSMTQSETRLAEITKLIRTPEGLSALRKHLNDIIQGDAFRGSRRSAQFLQYVIEKSISQDALALKERSIGIELFGRNPSYDTSEDAIVRVTASDVRRRLLQHYGRFGDASAFRINLSPGSYIPDIYRDQPFSAVEYIAEPASQAIEMVAPIAAPAPQTSAHAVASVELNVPPARQSRPGWLWPLLILAFINLIGGGLLWRSRRGVEPMPIRILPWSALFNPPHTTQIITSDPNIAEIQGLTGHPVSVSDYANQKYGCDSLPPDQAALAHVCRFVLRGDKAAQVDTAVIAKIAALAQMSGGRVLVHGARTIRLSDLNTDDNFIFLGSFLTDPWADLFSDQLDFRIVFDPSQSQEVIRNLHPRPGESPSYVPTAKGFGTGRSYATISFVRNPNHTGYVLLLAGADAEGTEASGSLVTNLPQLDVALKKCGIGSSGAPHPFQMVLQLNTMAGSPTRAEVIACHILADSTSN